MTNMYQIVDTRNHTVVETGFERKEPKRKGDKKAAKPARDTLNDGVKNSDPFIISRGEDHPRGPSNGISIRRRGRKSRF